MRIFATLNEDADMENLSLDSTSVKAHQHSAGAKKGAVNSEVKQFIGSSRGGKTTKIHAIVDGLGNPLYFQLSAGKVHDATMAIEVLSHVDITDSTILADKAYGTNEILDFMQTQDADYTIPPKNNARVSWRCDWWLYKERHLVECFFLKLKNFRQVASRYDKLASSFLAFVYITAIFILLKWYNPSDFSERL